MSRLQHFRDVYIIAFVAWMKYFNIILRPLEWVALSMDRLSYY